jgi:glutamine synthetase
MRNTIIKLEYVWIDGFKPWGLRSKKKAHSVSMEEYEKICNGVIDFIPEWGFDGSSTGQATGKDSDCILRPARVFADVIAKDCESFVVMCEVFNGDGTSHETNNRHALVIADKITKDDNPWFGMEQEYTIMYEGRPLGFPQSGYPAPQGIYYCSVGGDRTFGRKISDDHLDVCIEAGINITGTNSEVMPGQWEYQVGGPGVGALDVSDQLWASRWLLLKIAEKYGMTVTFDPKPMLGDWNGAGCHTNFSTDKMRQEGGMFHIEQACKRLSNRVDDHLKGYGEGIELRLTGDHETCSYKEFKWGIADRTASVRIPRSVGNEGCGYLEDRRPNSNCDPYVVTRLLLETVCASE